MHGSLTILLSVGIKGRMNGPLARLTGFMYGCTEGDDDPGPGRTPGTPGGVCGAPLRGPGQVSFNAGTDRQVGCLGAEPMSNGSPNDYDSSRPYVMKLRCCHSSSLGSKGPAQGGPDRLSAAVDLSALEAPRAARGSYRASGV